MQFRTISFQWNETVAVNWARVQCIMNTGHFSNIAKIIKSYFVNLQRCLNKKSYFAMIYVDISCNCKIIMHGVCVCTTLVIFVVCGNRHSLEYLCIIQDSIEILQKENEAIFLILWWRCQVVTKLNSILKKSLLRHS